MPETLDQPITVGLRFERSQAFPLMVVADALRAFHPDDVKLMLLGHEAARSGEPLVMTCKDIEEANRIATIYSDHGLKRPVIEQLNGGA